MKPPTVEEVAAFIAEKGFTFTAAEFMAYYEPRGWHYGGKDGDKTPMRSWKRACYNWQRNERRAVNRNLVGSHVTAISLPSQGSLVIEEPEGMPPEIRELQRRADARGEMTDEEIDKLVEWKRRRIQ